MPKTPISNVLADRYASEKMRRVWSTEQKVLFERDLWIAIMKAQRELGLDVPAEAIEAYERVRDDVNLERIARRERELRHDVKSRIEEFCELAGHEHIHKGMTSRDLTDNVEQLQIRKSLLLFRDKYVSLLRHVAEAAERWADVPIAARTHNVAAQPTTVGRRLAMFAQEMLLAFRRLESLIDGYALRGVVGAVGTALDQLTLFNGLTGGGAGPTQSSPTQNSPANSNPSESRVGPPPSAVTSAAADKVARLNERVMEQLGFAKRLQATGQVYPRSLDYEVVSTIYQLGSGPANFCRTLRLMAGHELAGEGFKEGQVGSSAMPHKMNSRSCERVCGFQAILNGHLNMVAALAGDQWNEGDVSCSVVRRVALPDAFFAADGMCETFLTILNEMGVNRAAVDAELRRYLPFLASTTILMESVKRGAGREQAHEAIKRHAVAVAREMREQGLANNDLPQRLGADPDIPLTVEEIEAFLADARDFIGAAKAQVEAIRDEVRAVTDAHPDAAAYEPGEIL